MYVLFGPPFLSGAGFFVAATATRGAISAAVAAFTTHLAVYHRGDRRRKRRGKKDNQHDFARAHIASALPRFERRNFILPLPYSAADVPATKATAAHKNAVHHQVPTVYTAVPIK